MDFEESSGVALLASPIAGEISVRLLAEVAKRFDWIYLDPQGFLRRFSADGRVSLGPGPPGLLAEVAAVKVDVAEARALTGQSNLLVAAQSLLREGPDLVLLSQGGRSLLLVDRDGYSRIPVPGVKAQDTTGAGDILGGAFVATYVRGGSPEWSACVGVAAATLAIAHRGIGKIPAREKVLLAAKGIQERVVRRKL
jgi:sugar/nucleoside kinase (ribokinase family)